MIAVLRCSALFGWLLMAVGCNYADRATAPTPFSPVTPSTTVQPPQSPPSFPPVSGPAQIFVFHAPSSYRVQDYTVASRYVLYDGGTFTLQYASLGIEYPGFYEEADGGLSFRFRGDGRWDAAGTFNGDLLDIHYNIIMSMSDFDDAVYRRSQ